MDSLFVTGTDTDVGKTYVAAGLAASLHVMGFDVGVMKPFAAGAARKSGRSDDVRMLLNAAGADDDRDLVNPQFFPIAASPYTAWKSIGIRPRVGDVMSAFGRLKKLHEVVIVEGIGGLMTPIRRDFFVADLIQRMNVPAVIVARNKIGTVNHTIMTCKICMEYGISLKGVIINCFEKGYPVGDLVRDLRDLTGVDILGTIPFISDMSGRSLHRTFGANIDLKRLFGL